MVYLLAVLIVASALVPALWVANRLRSHRTDLPPSEGPALFMWGNPVHQFDPARYTAEGRKLLRWLWVCEVMLIVAVGVALAVLARAGLL